MANTYRTAQDADTPFVRWRFEEPSGSTFTDDILAKVATITGSVTAGVVSPIGSARPAAGFGGDFTGGYALLTGTSTWSALQTIEALVVLDSIPASTLRPAIFAHAWTTGQQIPLVLAFNIDSLHSSKLGFGYYDGTGWHAASMSTNLPTGQLLHLVGVYNGTTGLTLYVNGTSVATAVVTSRAGGTLNNGAYIGRRWDQSDAIDGRVHDLALYNSGLSSTRVGVHAVAATAVAGIVIFGGGKPSAPDGIPRVAGDATHHEIHISAGGHPRMAAPQQLLVPGDGTSWATYGELSSQPGGEAQWWRYDATDTGTLTVDTHGAGWDTVLTVYAADRTTVLASNDDDPGLPAYGADGYTGESLTSLSVTAATTYYVRVTAGAHASSTGGEGRYTLTAEGPRAAAAPQVEFPGISISNPPPTIPAAASPPAGMTVVPIKRVSRVYPAPSLVAGRPTQPWTHSSETIADWGNFQVVVAGVDVTYFRGFPAQIQSYTLQEPWGCGPASITFPGITPHDAVGTGDTNWLIGGYYVDIVGPSGQIWNGQIGKQVGQYDAQRGGYTIECIGDIWQADLVSHQPRTYLPAVDVGSMVPVVLNLVPHRHVWGIAQVSTGIKTTQRGSTDTSVIGYAQELLATAQTTGGGQWTIARTGPRQYAMQLKDRTTVTWTVQTGQPGVECRLELDSMTAVNRIFGRGVAPNGYAWAGWVYPSTGIAAAPAYPNASPSSTLTVGSTDAGTTSGSGVTDWQQRMNGLGYSVTVDGTYDAADAAAAKQVQTAKGLTVDGVTGPQTWAATFDVGNNGSDLTAAYRAPLAALSSVTPTLTQADGSSGGVNPADNANLIVVDRDEDFGDGVTKAYAVRSAQAELARSANPGWAGEVVLTADPQEVSRFDIKEGSNGVIKGWAGRDVTVHVAGVSVAPPSDGGPGSVTLTVDERARDLVTLGAILRRDRDASRNPAMLPPRKQRRSQSRPDNVVEFDGESSGGIIPKHALFGGLWTVIRIPVSQAGKVAQVIAQTVPATPFVLAFFGDAVTPADLTSLVGANPLLERTDGYGPFDKYADKLAVRGFIEALGGPGQACGYSPGYDTSPHTGLPTPLTGKLVSTGSWTYQSAKPPWLWLAEYAVASTFISGRIYPAPMDT
jgi:peptidoglycan hydrolase-like protein with peptidoglycan-binding domain